MASHVNISAMLSIRSITSTSLCLQISATLVIAAALPAGYHDSLERRHNYTRLIGLVGSKVFIFNAVSYAALVLSSFSYLRFV